MEGCHLRAGPVARGGIRWSDRREDFRTEILGLMKAQRLKNVIIVPTGAKGGFVLKHPPPMTDREAFQAEGIACYRTLVRGMLDLADNYQGTDVVTPPGIVRRDGDDPYIVAAADKGTATFSDIANGLSAEYGFWLGDAFASGGSAGYDHKGMGITARGAWVMIDRHFQEMLGPVGAGCALRHGRRRRHVGRRVRQRAAGVAPDAAARGLRPPAHLPRPRPRPRGVLRRARAAVRAAALVLGGLRRAR